MSELDILDQQIRRVRRDLDRRVGEAKALATMGKKLQNEIVILKSSVTLHEQAAVVLTSIGEERQLTAQRQIEALVTRGLQVVFGEDLTFHLVQVVRSKRPEVEFVVRTHFKDGNTLDTEIMSSRGGGLASVVGFLLRLVVLLLTQGKRFLVLGLDETFAFLSEDLHDRMAEFLKELVDKTGVQIIMVTHTPALGKYADKMYRFHQVNGLTKVTEEIPEG